jgi:hypothetical protein
MPRLDNQRGEDRRHTVSGSAHLGSRRLPGSLYWLCVVGPAFAILELLMLAFAANRQRPPFFLILMAGVFGVCVYLFYRTFGLVRDGLQLRTLLRQDHAPQAETETLQNAKDLAQGFFQITFGIGLAIAVLRLVLLK